MDAATGEVHARGDLSAAYANGAGVNSWQREIDFVGGHLKVHDTFSKTADTEAVFQVNVPVQPVINGREARAGRLLIKVIQPEDAVLSTLDWSSLDKAEFRSGWRVDAKGSGDAFLVELSDGGS
jgi:hypothetical protein